MALEKHSLTGFGDNSEMAQPAMPELIKRILSAFEDSQEWVEDFDPLQPVTSLHILEDRMKTRLDLPLPQDFDPVVEFENLKDFLENASREGTYVEALEEAALAPVVADARLLHLHYLLDECDRTCHGSPIWILGPSIDAADWKQSLSILGPLFEGERASSREELARRAAEAFLLVSEPHYLAYLRHLVALVDTRRGERRTPGTFKDWKLGWFLKVVSRGLPGADIVVELEAHRIRNAIAHRDIRYDPGTQRLLLKDSTGEEFMMAPATLFQKAKGMYEVGVLGLQKLRSLWILRLFRRGRLFEAAVASLSLENEAEIKKVFGRYGSELAQMVVARSQLRAIPEKTGLK